MKKIVETLRVKIAFTALVFTTACMLQMSESIIDPNVDYNGGFEIVKNQLPVNWLFYTQKTVKDGRFTIDVDTINFIDGKQSLHFNVASCSGKVGRFSPGISQEIEVSEGDTYHVSARIKSTRCSINFQISAVDAFHTSNGTPLLVEDKNQEWKTYNASIVIPKHMKRLRLELNVLSPGEVWLDAVRIQKIQ